MWIVTNLLRITDLYRTQTYLKSIAPGRTGGLSNEPPKNRRSEKGEKNQAVKLKRRKFFFSLVGGAKFFRIFFCKCNLTRVMTHTHQ